jgi:CRISPR-associated protein Csb2
MLTVSVELLHGVLRAGTADDTALSGAGGAAEWPPSPARIFAALVSGAGTGERPPSHVATLGLDLLQTAPPPQIYASGPSDVNVTAVNDRYVVIDEHSQGSVQEYPARSAQRVSPGARVSPRDSRVSYVWPDLDASEEELAALRFRAARVPYVGCADSPATVTISTTQPPTDLPEWVADNDGSIVLPVLDPDLLERLDDSFNRWSSGQPVRRSWFHTELCRYRSPDDPPDGTPDGEAPFTVWVRFSKAINGRRLVRVAETLRAAVLTHVEEITGSRDAVPAVLHGHLQQRGEGQHSARWLPLPTVGTPYADGRIRGACIWLPSTATPEQRELTRQAVSRINELILPGVFGTDVSVFDGTSRPWTSHPWRWIGPTSRWVSVTPVVHDRHSKRGVQLKSVARWCLHAGLPEPIAFRESPVPLTHGSIRLSRSDLGRGDRLKGPVSFFELEFKDPVRGPVVLGRGRGFGLGLCAPVADGAGPR